MVSEPAFAQGARDWENVPVDTNILFLYYTYSNTEASVDLSLPIEGVSVDAHVPIARYARSFGIAGRAAAVQLIVPYGFVTARLDGTNLQTHSEGLGDVNAVFVMNISGAPALTRREFAAWQPSAYLTGSIGVTAPTGAYDAGSLLNIGKNRWMLKPQVSYGKYLGRRALFAVNGNVQLFTVNDKYRGDGRLQQRALVGVDGHISHDVGNGAWLSLDAVYAHGGTTKFNGVAQDNRQQTLRLGASGSVSLDPATAINVGFTRSVAKKDYTPTTTTFSFNISRVF
ncbi:transporter [Sphingomonas sp. ABOLD]|nr:transporter [Sphingomonas trueperi]RSV32661.1 transporter [Sphingomonas sp. ABOLE]RSV36422.1 transporter [Sphingomonas sp. ABOLD]